MKKNVEVKQEKFEFILYRNGNIICQRYLKINGYNPDCVNSIELKEMMDSIAGINNDFGMMGIIPKYLKDKSIEYLWSEYNPYDIQTEEEIVINKPLTNDNFVFEVRVDKEVIARSLIDGSIFPPRGKVGIDIKSIAKDIYSNMWYYMTLKNYTKNYCEVNL